MKSLYPFHQISLWPCYYTLPMNYIYTHTFFECTFSLLQPAREAKGDKDYVKLWKRQHSLLVACIKTPARRSCVGVVSFQALKCIQGAVYAVYSFNNVTHFKRQPAGGKADGGINESFMKLLLTWENELMASWSHDPYSRPFYCRLHCCYSHFNLL